MEDELAVVAANGENGSMDWPLGAQHVQVRLDPLPGYLPSIPMATGVLYSAGPDWR
jgi:hypothetical protein